MKMNIFGSSSSTGRHVYIIIVSDSFLLYICSIHYRLLFDVVIIICVYLHNISFGRIIGVVLRKACVINHDSPWSLCLYVYECIFFMLVASFMQTMKKGINFIL